MATARHIAALAHLNALRRAVLRRGTVAARAAGRRRRRRPRLSAELLGILRGVYDATAAMENPWEAELHCRTCVGPCVHAEHAPSSAVGPARGDA